MLQIIDARIIEWLKRWEAALLSNKKKTHVNLQNKRERKIDSFTA